MASMLLRAIDEAGFAAARQRALAGAGLSPPDLERLRTADLLVVAGLADLVRKNFRGDVVRLIGSAQPHEPELHLFEPAGPAADGSQRRYDAAETTGAELLREIALTRLRVPGRLGLAVSLDELGVELAQTALVFGADVLFGDLAGKRSLPLIDGPDARRVELTGLIERSGRRVIFGPTVQPVLEQHS